MADAASKFRPYIPLGLIVVVFAAVIILINPLWETAFSDDWAFAQMSHHLLETGDYVQNAWLAPNSPFHVYWGALFSKVGGYSLGSLRLATLSLLLLALISLYFLAREFGFGSDASAVLSLILLESPLVLLMSFTFMSDVPFLALLTLSLLFLCRGIRRESYPLMLAGSATVAATILVRQLGAIMVPALAITWFLGKDRKRLLPIYLAALPLPLLALGWLIGQPQSWALRWFTVTQGIYLRTPQLFVPQAVWRVMVTLQYLAFSVPALTLLALVEVANLLRTARGSKSREKDLWLVIGFTLFILGVSVFGTFVMGERGIIPWVPWNLNDLATAPPVVPALITLFTTFGAVALGRIFCLRVLAARQDAAVAPHEALLDFVTLGLFLVNLINVQIGDRYFIPLLPYTVIIAGRFLLPWINRFWRQAVAVILALLLVNSLWIRATLSERAAEWQGAQSVLALGIEADQIIGTNEWNLYHGSFDAYLKSIGDEITPQSQDDYFNLWRAEQLTTAHYRTTTSEGDLPDPGWKVIATFPYRDILLQERQVYVQQRTGGE